MRWGNEPGCNAGRASPRKKVRLFMIYSASASSERALPGRSPRDYATTVRQKKNCVDSRSRYPILFSTQPFITAVNRTAFPPSLEEPPMLLSTNKIVLALASLASVSVLAWAQASFEAQIRGVVRDSSGSVVARAKMTITDVDTNISNSTLTDERGFYIFNGLHPATYISRRRWTGFRPEETKNVVLGVSQHTNVDFSLQVAGLGLL